MAAGSAGRQVGLALNREANKQQLARNLRQLALNSPQKGWRNPAKALELAVTAVQRRGAGRDVHRASLP